MIKPPRPRPRRHEYQLGMAELAGAAVRNAVQQAIKLVRMAPTMARAAPRRGGARKDDNGKRQWGLPKTSNCSDPRTLLNVAITNQRTFAGRTIPLAETKTIAKAFGCRSMTW